MRLVSSAHSIAKSGEARSASGKLCTANWAVRMELLATFRPLAPHRLPLPLPLRPEAIGRDSTTRTATPATVHKTWRDRLAVMAPFSMGRHRKVPSTNARSFASPIQVRRQAKVAFVQHSPYTTLSRAMEASPPLSATAAVTLTTTQLDVWPPLRRTGTTRSDCCDSHPDCRKLTT